VNAARLKYGLVLMGAVSATATAKTDVADCC
jgi:hypothetical protein